MSDERFDLPSVDSPNFLPKLRELLMTYLGRQGDPLNRGITLRDLEQSGIAVRVDGTPGSGSSGSGGGGRGLVLTPGSALQPVYVVDLTPPPEPTGFTAQAGVGYIFIQHENPTYKQGNGHERTVVYGAKYAGTGGLPTFFDAVKLGEFLGSTYALATDPATQWHLWIKWQSRDGVLSSSPAGGTNGVTVTTAENVDLLLKALAGQITETELYRDLGERIDQVDGGAAAIQVKSYNGGLNARYTVKIDVAGLVSGYGLASEANNGKVSSAFAIRSDQFYIAPPSLAQSSAPTTGLFNGFVWLDTSVKPNVTRYYTGGTYVGEVYQGGSWTTTPPNPLLVVQTSPITVNGKRVLPGVYMDAAFIKNGTITSAMIQSLSADDITTGTLKVGLGGSAGFLTSQAVTKVVGGLKVAKPSTDFNATWDQLNGYYLGEQAGTYKFYVGNSLFSKGMRWDGSDLTIRGIVYATAGRIAGIDIDAEGITSPDYVYNVSGFKINYAGGLGGIYANQGTIGGIGINRFGIVSGNYVYRTSGFFFDSVNGRLYANSGEFSGSVNVGAMTGYAWPAAGLSGAHLSSAGFLLGNANGGGKYFQVALGGPGNEAAISTNIPAYLADAQVTTLKIGPNQVTVPVAAQNASSIGPSTAYTDTIMLSLSIDTGGFPVYVSGVAHVTFSWTGGPGSNFMAVRTLVNGSIVGSEKVVYCNSDAGGLTDPATVSIPIAAYVASPGTGSIPVTITARTLYPGFAIFANAGDVSILALGVKR